MLQQLSFIEQDTRPPCSPVALPTALPDDPTAIVVSVSGGLDSVACAIWARQRWPDRPLIFWHAHLAEMDWQQTDEQLCNLAEALGNCHLISVQAVYGLNGEITPSGANGTTLRRLHTVRDGDIWYGPAKDNDDKAILTLLDFARKARNGQPPTSKLRWCTSYFKARACDVWLRTNRNLLGDRPLLLSGERHAESPGRSNLPQAQWRFGRGWEQRHPMLLAKHGTRNNHAWADPQTQEWVLPTWDVLWYRPVINWPWHQVVQASVDAGISIHPGYALQGETITAMCDPSRDERGRARLSCICCIFSHQQHIAIALHNAPAVVGPAMRAIQQYEQATGYSWQQRGMLLPNEKGEHHASSTADCCLP